MPKMTVFQKRKLLKQFQKWRATRASMDGVGGVFPREACQHSGRGQLGRRASESAGSRTIPPWALAHWTTVPRTITTQGNFAQTIPTQNNCSPDNSLRTSSTTDVAPWAIPPDNSHLGLLIFTPGQSLPRAMTVTNFSRLFSVSFPWPNYIFIFFYDSKNNNDNSNKTWTLKLLRVIIL